MIKQIKHSLNDKRIAIAAIDIPELTNLDKAYDAVYGIGIVTGIFNLIGIPNIDAINKMPFTTHTASHSNGVKLDSLGLNIYTPEVKLGFHNDGLLSHQKVEIPQHIALYNLFISYKKPGNFIWIPTSLWEEAEKYSSKKIQNDYIHIKLTPTFHLKQKCMVYKSGFEFIKVPIAHTNLDGQTLFFLNGQVVSDDNTELSVNLVQRMRESLQNNPQKIYIPQKERRFIMLKNTLGFHARDVFEEPIGGTDLSRVLLRMVDTNAELYPSIQIA